MYAYLTPQLSSYSDGKIAIANLYTGETNNGKLRLETRLFDRVEDADKFAQSCFEGKEHVVYSIRMQVVHGKIACIYVPIEEVIACSAAVSEYQTELMDAVADSIGACLSNRYTRFISVPAAIAELL